MIPFRESWYNLFCLMIGDFIAKSGLNWVDFIAIIVLFFYFIEGYFIRFIASVLDLLGFVLSFIAGLKGYGILGKWIKGVFSISIGFSNVIGFLIIAFIAEAVFGYISRRIIYNEFASKIRFRGFILETLDRLLGGFVGLLSGLILLSFIFSVIAGLPVSLYLKRSVVDSKIGSFLIGRTQGFEKDLNAVFGGAVNDTLNFLTIEPESKESVGLNFKVSNVSIDESAEKEMFAAVNKERASRGLSTLAFDRKLTENGRKHCIDMFKRGYFSHYTPEGLTPFDRMAQDDIYFTYAGENLALAPNVPTAMQGLMNSPGHKANILSKNFGTVGIGAIDGGIYGQMYCQEFTD